MLDFKQKIDEGGITADLVNDIIDAHKQDNERMLNLYERYKADLDGPPIFRRSAVEYEDDFERGGNVRRLDDKVNNRLNNAFDVDIVDTKTGYLFGHPISYDVDQECVELKKEIENFLLRNNMDDIDAELGKMAAICGYGARIAYIDKEGFERVKNLDPWEVVLFGDDIHEPEYSLRYYNIGEKLHAEFYDNKEIYYFEVSNGSKLSLTEQKPHMFEFNPLFGVANNAELKGDAEKVLALIDAYDRTLSDASNEIEQYRLAYLILRGMGMDDEQITELKKNGIFELFGENDDVRYLTKDINDGMIENHLNRLEANIMRFAKTVNFTDESFGTQLSGVALRFKIMALENKSVVMERKFTSALRYQFKVLFSAWEKRRSLAQEDYLKVFFTFTRNIPVNLLDEAQTTQALKGNVSERTRLAALSIVDDVDYELEEMQKDALLYGNALEPIETSLIDDDLPGDEKQGSKRSKEDAKADGTDTCPECQGTGEVMSIKSKKPVQCGKCKGDGKVTK